jgi:hypothetical protein
MHLSKYLSYLNNIGLTEFKTYVKFLEMNQLCKLGTSCAGVVTRSDFSPLNTRVEACRLKHSDARQL